jgi:minimal PKS ketosynthase (KS/KS alpha)
VQRGVVPPTANYEVPDPECDLDYVPNVAREQKIDVALSVGSGFGGFQSAIVLTSPTRRSA